MLNKLLIKEELREISINIDYYRASRVDKGLIFKLSNKALNQETLKV